ncbi:MAG: CDP-glycerol glycerophosphotransferase family protein [Flavobacteriaceae bacterium]|nr:CDP-glycerol glycerophosphotransferase family protein [Flavobacteriaceae bacterium]
MNNHKVTIITPIYNVEKYIERCAVSLFEQDFEDIEYIFVNDCTPDNSVEILQKVIEKYPLRKPNIKIVHHKENKGLGSTRKTGLEQATGEYVLHIDSDDWCELDMVSSLYNKAKETDADIVVCNFFKSYKDKDIYCKQEYSLCKEKDLHRLLQSNKLFNYVWNKLIKRSLYEKYNIYPSTKINFWEDKWIIIRLFCEDIRYSYVPNAFVHYWQENENSLSKENAKTFEDIKYFTQTTEQFLKEKGLFEKYKDSLYIGNLKTIIWQSKSEYDRKIINDICPEANRLKYIDAQPNWSVQKKKKYKLELVKHIPFLPFLINLYWIIPQAIMRLFQYTFFYLSYLMPRDKNMWIFGGHHGHFADNTKHLFLYVAEYCPEIRAIWITKNKELVNHLKNKGFEVYCKYSLKGIFYALRGKFYIFHSHLEDINLSASGGTIKVNLWHGAPIKRIRFSTTFKGKTASIFVPSLKNKFVYPYFYINSDYILSTSKRVTKYFAEAFRVKENQCMELGYPRNEILNYSEDKLVKFIEKYEPTETKTLINRLKTYKKVFVYMPTWRDNGRNFIQNAGIDFEILNKVLEAKDYVLVLKLHRYTTLPMNLHQYKNIILFGNDLDIYPILPFTDCLITDYSSIYFDYHLMEKEVILFPFDKDEYIDKDREMYFEYDEVVENELVVNSFDELVEAIKTDKKSSGVKNKLLQEMILETKGIESCKEIVKLIKN